MKLTAWTSRKRLVRSGALLVVLVGACALRLSVIGSQPLWVDEFFSLAMATGHSLEHPAAEADPAQGDFVESAGAERPSYYARYLAHDSPPAGLQRVLRAVRLSDTNPPLYYVLLWGWTRLLGTGDRALRLFSVLASLGALALAGVLARRTFGRPAVLPTLVLFAVSPVGLYYSTEGRMYALLWLWVTATLALALSLRTRGSRPALLAAFVMAGAAGLLTHYFFAPPWLLVSAWLLAHPGRARRGAVAAATALTAALAAPWYARIPDSLGQWRVTGGWLNVAPADYDQLRAPFATAWSLVSVRVAWGVPLALDVANGIVLLVLVGLAARSLGRRAFSPPRRVLWLAAVAGVGTPVCFDLALGTHASAWPRYALAALPPTLVLLGGALAAVRPRPRVVLAALLVALSLAGSWRVRRAWSRKAQPFAQVSAFLASEVRPSDVVVVRGIPSAVCGIARYLVWQARPEPGPPLAAWVSQLGLREVPRDLVRLTADKERVFLVTIHALGATVGEEEWLRQEGRLVLTRAFESASVLVFERREGGAFARAEGQLERGRDRQPLVSRPSGVP